MKPVGTGMSRRGASLLFTYLSFLTALIAILTVLWWKHLLPGGSAGTALTGGEKL